MKLNKQLEILVIKLNQIKQEHTEKEIPNQTHANWKCLLKCDLMTAKIYKELIKESTGSTYLYVRWKLAVCLLSVTGVSINELLNSKVAQLQTLIEES